MKLIVGLGNPGKEYNNTRHNIGFSFIDYYLKYKNINDKWNNKNEGLFIITNLYGEKVVFLKPQTYMNLSGNCVIKFMKYYDISVEDILVISDDLDLKVGNYKLKGNGSCGGHNGLRDIENKIGSSNYKRLKIGIFNDKTIDTKDYVLGSISKDDSIKYDELFKNLCVIIDEYFSLDFGDLMSKYNRKNK